MGFLSRLLGTAPVPALEHPLFGALTWNRTDGWTNARFALWGFEGVELLIDAPEQGPSEAQCEAFRRFESRRAELWPKALGEVERLRAQFGLKQAAFRVSGLTLPSLGPERAGTLWTLWLDLDGEDQFLFGVQTDDDWETLAGFADD